MRKFMREQCRRPGKIFAMAMVLVMFFAAAGAVVMLLWNWLMPTLFAGVHSVDYWQALGLLVLSKVLFGSRSFHGKRCRRWESITGEEREEIKRHFKSRWGAHLDRLGGQE